MAKKKLSVPVDRMPWARNQYKQDRNGYDRRCTECDADAVYTIDWEYSTTSLAQCRMRPIRPRPHRTRRLSSSCD